ncbi:D-alanyl-D-alanine carboxypeptidase family protein [Kingella negevensis]|uniref:D-alanyl-D-alanine carboxypeptidase family protein n=1 Tax=Kingella negevensis TaxID=1522312 RepID=UPI00050A1757|nr:serine hydrolase [Kingella negevensis]MDK4687696.1 serine hydrolase [Kingella negevensis]WII91308.1 serine hydrolase [Kingella negevensis]
MVFSNFSKTFCVGTLLGLSVITPANAYDNEDVLGRFLEQNFSAQQKLQAAQPQATQARTTAEVDPLASYFPQQQSTAAVSTSELQQQAAFAGPMLKAQSALIMNAKTGQILYQKNMESVRSIASISKLMSAMVILDAKLDMNQRITITEDEIDRLKGTSSRLSIGTTLTRTELLHLGLMSSENRAIHALARTYPGGMSAFVAAMNAKARSLGMMNSQFYEPTGLDPRNVSTALELSKMVQAASRYAKIRELTTSNYGQAYTSAGKVQEYKNSNVLVREGQWNITLQKTGYIREAGRSMVLQAQMGRDPVVIVVLGSATSASRANDARALGDMAQMAL